MPDEGQLKRARPNEPALKLLQGVNCSAFSLLRAQRLTAWISRRSFFLLHKNQPFKLLTRSRFKLFKGSNVR